MVLIWFGFIDFCHLKCLRTTKIKTDSVSLFVFNKLRLRLPDALTIEWRLELDHEGQDYSICWAVLQEDGITRRVLHVGSGRLHSILQKEKCWTRCETQQKKL